MRGRSETKLFPASEIYAGIGIAKAPLVFDAPRDGLKSWDDHRRSSLAARLRRPMAPESALEPAGQALRAAFG
jgi:hypothetical protein